VDGNDVLAVREEVGEAVARARSGGGPSFIECKTWRHHGHFEGENPTYRNEEDHRMWLKRDPIDNYGSLLVRVGRVTPVELAEIEARVKGAIDEAVRFAEESPLPAPESALEDVFAE